MPQKIEISHRTIVFTVFFLGLLWFLFFIRDIILQIFVALLIMAVLNPTVTKLQKRKVPRAASVLIVYFLVFGFFVGFSALLVPALAEQSASFATSIPKLFQGLNIPIFIVDETTRQLSAQLAGFPSQIVKISISVFSNLVSVITVLFFALYFLLARDKLDKNLDTFIKKNHVERIEKVLNDLETGLGGWARGQLMLMFMVGFSTYIGLMVLGVPFAVPLALLAGILEIVPNLGPVLSAVPAVIVGFGISPLTGVAVAALSFLIQQIEAYLLVPKIMEKSAGVSPIVTLLALIIGFRVAGVVGAVLSVPIVITSRVLLKEFVFNKR